MLLERLMGYCESTLIIRFIETMNVAFFRSLTVSSLCQLNTQVQCIYSFIHSNSHNNLTRVLIKLLFYVSHSMPGARYSVAKLNRIPDLSYTTMCPNL